MTGKPTTLSERFGEVPNESGLTNRMRTHQGWWRTNVLNEPPGQYPMKAGRTICNTISNGNVSEKNFLTANIVQTVRATLESRDTGDLGIIEQDRLFNNLLSSQPLCFNFFGELDTDKTFGLSVLKSFYPDLTKLNKVIFEYAPRENYTQDHSAFDVAFEVEAGYRQGMIGFECKYTDSFSFKPNKSSVFYGDRGSRNHDVYKGIFEASQLRRVFSNPYYEFVRSKDFNQLFRNQLIAESILQNGAKDFFRTGLFCHDDDKYATSTGESFRNMMSNRDDFRVITYKDFITRIQKLDIDWKKREWTMLLWARYCGTQLSDATVSELRART